mmetsp:Transcript_13410/g.36867  ORF Transcript_13410/g.36867 Transcript_13410/m.36867 type:complete len:400 (-) Transcript_13410:154-1353(-)
MVRLATCVFSFAASVSALSTPSDPRPIVGILTQPLHALVDYNVAFTSYIAASYVEFAESAGLRVVPVHFDASEDDLRTLFSQINGLIFPGGGANIQQVHGNKFRASAQFLFELALEANDEGDRFPIYGICLGFELLMVMAARTDSVLCFDCFASNGLPLPLDITAAARTSSMFAQVTPALWTALTTENITENSHHDGVTPDEFINNRHLRDFFTVLSTNRDRKGKRFVSTVESRIYPITGTQWHPEKNNFEWGKVGRLGYSAFPHSPPAVLLSQLMADQFALKAIESGHRFADDAVKEAVLIYNDEPGPDPAGYFTQIYSWSRGPQDQTSSELSQNSFLNTDQWQVAFCSATLLVLFMGLALRCKVDQHVLRDRLLQEHIDCVPCHFRHAPIDGVLQVL